jgi:ribonuclease PH
VENTEENCEKIWKLWKKGKLNSEKILQIWKKAKLNSEKIWKIQKKIVKRYGNYERKR